jgi:hypothetical protein
MAITFTLSLDLTDHEHPGNPAAQHAKVREWLGLAMQAIGSDLKRKGELTIPCWDASLGVNHHAPIGSWEFTDAGPGS